MNRSLTNVLFGGISAPTAIETKIEGTVTKTTVDETVEYLANADSVILVCRHYVDLCSRFYPRMQVVGYGMAVARAQYAISEITASLRSKGINVRVCSVIQSIFYLSITKPPTISISSQFTLSLVVCQDSATYSWLRLQSLTTVRCHSSLH